MGYRNYIGVMPKREYNKIKSLTIDEVYNFYDKSDEDDKYIGVYDFGVELHEFGKYVDFDPPKCSIKTFFKKKPTELNWNEDGELKVVTKEFLAYIIESYRVRISNYYNEMVKPLLISSDRNGFYDSVKVNYGSVVNYTFDFSLITKEEQTMIYLMIEHVRSMRIEWSHLTPFELDDKSEICTSYKYEYIIFELVRIYKTFDWKRNVMYYYGY